MPRLPLTDSIQDTAMRGLDGARPVSTYGAIPDLYF